MRDFIIQVRALSQTEEDVVEMATNVPAETGATVVEVATGRLGMTGGSPNNSTGADVVDPNVEAEKGGVKGMRQPVPSSCSGALRPKALRGRRDPLAGSL